MSGLARCVLCRREVEFEDAAPKRCKASEGGCGAAGAMRVLRTASKPRVTPEYAAPPRLSERARGLEEALAREAG